VGAPLRPTLSSITPSSAIRGTPTAAHVVPVTLSGSNLSGTSAVTLTPAAGITVSGITSTATTVNATFTITSAAAPGAHSVSVTTASGTSVPVTFTVIGPTLTSINPTTGLRGTQGLHVVFTGTNLNLNANGTTTNSTCSITGLGTGVTVAGNSCHVQSATSGFVNLNIAANAPFTTSNIAVVTPLGATNTVAFTVVSTLPTISNPPTPLPPSTAFVTVPATLSVKHGLVTVTNTTAVVVEVLQAPGPGGGLGAAAAVIQTAGTTNGTFAVTNAGSCQIGSILQPGDSCTIGVGYGPTTTGTATAHVQINYNLGGVAAPTQNGPNFNAN
jgi:hypothetical protein